jgi:hypothetical protein
MLKEGGNPSRITHGCILFNSAPDLVANDIDGYFADPTPRDNTEYLNYAAEAENTGNGFVNVGRHFVDATGYAIHRKDLLQIATHEIGHVLGLDSNYSGFKTNVPGGRGLMEIKPPLPAAGLFALHRPGAAHREPSTVAADDL